MDVIAGILQVLLGLAFIGAGTTKLMGIQMQVENFDRWRLPQSFRPIVGIVEIIGAIGMLVGLLVPVIGLLAALWLSATMVGALFTHARIKDSVSNYAPAAVLLTLSVIVLILRASLMA